MVKPFKEVFLLDVVDLEEVRLDSVKSILDIGVFFDPFLTNSSVNDCCNFLWEIINVLTLFYLDVKKSASKDITFRNTSIFNCHCTVPTHSRINYS